MKKLLTLALTAALIGGAIVSPAAAGKKKKAKPVKTTLYMHGDLPVGDMAEWIEGLSGGSHQKMDTTEPAAGPPKSHSYSLPIGNPECTGNELFPSWEGTVNGKIVGDMKLYANTLALPSTVTARVWVDVPFGSCTSETAGVDDFVDPIAEQEVEVPAGSNEVEIVFKKLKVTAKMNVIVELHTNTPTNQGRVLYDSSEFPTRLEFKCIPAKGAKACAA